MKRWLRRLLFLTLGLLVAVVALGFALHAERPSGRSGPEAEALAQRMLEASGAAAWAGTRAVRWRFGDRRDHLWDRERGYAEVRWGERRVLLDLHDRSGLAYEAGAEAAPERAAALLGDAWRAFANDSFWLNPLAKAHDPGTTRERVELDGGEQALLVRYSSGGVTPGDAYLWILGEDGLPTRWQMWVAVIPVGGLAATWEGWQTLPTGAKIATRHRGPLGLTLEITGLEAAAHLEELVTPDPFLALEARRAR